MGGNAPMPNMPEETPAKQPTPASLATFHAVELSTTAGVGAAAPSTAGVSPAAFAFPVSVPAVAASCLDWRTT